jgi:hypothetical protein
MPPSRVIYDKLPPGSHTVLPVDAPGGGAIDTGTGFRPHVDWERIELNAIAEVEDITDPRSHRAYQIRGHLLGFGVPGQYGYQGPLASLVSGPGPGALEAALQEQGVVQAKVEIEEAKAAPAPPAA